MILNKRNQVVFAILSCLAIIFSILSLYTSSSRFVLMGQLYDACSSYYVAPDTRSSDEWVSLTQCSNFIDSVLLSLDLPERVDIEQDDGTNTFLICPRPDSLWIENNERVFKPSEFVTMFLVFWDRKNAGLTTRYISSSRNSILEAFAPRYAPCLAAAML